MQRGRTVAALSSKQMPTREPQSLTRSSRISFILAGGSGRHQLVNGPGAVWRALHCRRKTPGQALSERKMPGTANMASGIRRFPIRRYPRGFRARILSHDVLSSCLPPHCEAFEYTVRLRSEITIAR